jgi:SprT-like family
VNTAKAFANVVVQGILDGSTDRDRAKAWDEACRLAQDPAARARAEAEARAKAKHDASFEAFKRRAYSRLAHRRAKEGATSGPGWRVIDRPHAELEALAKQIWDVAFHAIPFPDWRVRWGHLRPSTPGEIVFGRAVRSARVIVIDARAHTTGRALMETLLHELVHAVHGHQAGHGKAFAETLKRVTAVVVPDELAAPLAATPTAGPPPLPVGDARPVSAATLQPPTGMRWGPHGFVSQPGLDSHLEYRG